MTHANPMPTTINPEIYDNEARRSIITYLSGRETIPLPDLVALIAEETTRAGALPSEQRNSEGAVKLGLERHHLEPLSDAGVIEVHEREWDDSLVIRRGDAYQQALDTVRLTEYKPSLRRGARV